MSIVDQSDDLATFPLKIQKRSYLRPYRYFAGWRLSRGSVRGDGRVIQNTGFGWG
jgi:hypothetical protein